MIRILGSKGPPFCNGTAVARLFCMLLFSSNTLNLMPAEKEKEDIRNPKNLKPRSQKETSWLHLESGVKRSVVGVLLLAVAMVTTLAFLACLVLFRRPLQVVLIIYLVRVVSLCHLQCF